MTAVAIRLDGADERTRTADLLITNQLLYQLSYVGRGKGLGPPGAGPGSEVLRTRRAPSNGVAT